MTTRLKKTWGDVGKSLSVLTLAMFFPPLPVMLALGVWHLEIDPRVPALGYWPVLVILWGFGALLGKVKAKREFDKFRE